MLEGLDLFGMGYSWVATRAWSSRPTPNATARRPPGRRRGPCLRIHAGLEDPDDLIVNLEAGFARLNAAR
jgi:cysteine-S-conjugate beta-lyase